MKNATLLICLFAAVCLLAGCHHGHHHHHGHPVGPGLYQQGPHGGYGPVAHPVPARHVKPPRPPVVRPVTPPAARPR